MLKRTFESRNPKIVYIAICISNKATFGVCCASVESPLTNIDKIERVLKKAKS